MASGSTIALLDAQPDIARMLTDEERSVAGRLRLPVRSVAPADGAVDELLPNDDAFGAVVLEGILLQRFALGGHVALRLLGPQDIFACPQAPTSVVINRSVLTPATNARLMLLGNEVVAVGRGWPRILTALYSLLGEAGNRLSAQLAICQLPRVDDRVLAVLWLLAESWGHVTPAGTTVPFRLTHELLGGLIGARRSTVTLALRELRERGAVLQQPNGWLLREGPPGPPESALARHVPTAPQIQSQAEWAVGEREPVYVEDQQKNQYEALKATLTQLQEESKLRAELSRELLAQTRRTREHCRQTRERLSRPGVATRYLHRKDGA
jgi:CRP/FNR family transcriptional regulator, cyclic AMP receptor protein